MLEDAQPLFDDELVFVSVDVDDESDAAGVMLAIPGGTILRPA